MKMRMPEGAAYFLDELTNEAALVPIEQAKLSKQVGTEFNP